MATTPNLEQVEAETTAWIRHFLPRISINLARVDLLVDATQQSIGFIQRDVLRAAVVLLHATLEDFLRNLAADRLPGSSRPKALDGISLPGMTENKKFELADLVEHRTKTVEELLTESVRSHLESISYSNCTQIETLLTKIDASSPKAKGFFPKLEKMIARRHQIVHRADLPTFEGHGGRDAQNIDAETVRDWLTTVDLFTRCLAGTVLRNAFLSKLCVAMGDDEKKATDRLKELLETIANEKVLD